MRDTKSTAYIYDILLPVSKTVVPDLTVVFHPLPSVSPPLACFCPSGVKKQKTMKTSAEKYSFNTSSKFNNAESLESPTSNRELSPTMT